jgi:DNA-binding NtrC family response regulator
MMHCPQARICLIEDDPIMGESLCDRFDIEDIPCDWHQTAASAEQALARTDYALVISDVRLPDLDGGTLFERLRARKDSLPPFIFITAYGTIDRAVELLKQGAADYVTKPFDLEQLLAKVRALGRTVFATDPSEEVALGVSEAMHRISTILPRVARHASILLLQGESGVGKEYVARNFDRLARHSTACPFVPVNCGAISEGLFEAEFFGHEKGAFTGAVRAKRGFFEQAHCGTLFLDEIGELPLPMQVKLLRVIQERVVVRVGGEAPTPVDFRLVCATNRDLKEMVQQGLFREDLYYRVNVIQLRIPPLRERPDDIVWFAHRFIDEFASSHPDVRRALSPAAEEALRAYPWPGNLRELRHAIERACIFSASATLGPQAFFGEGLIESVPVTKPGNLGEYLQECERGYIRRALEQRQGHIAETAADLGISRKNLWEKMKKLQLSGVGSAEVTRRGS